MKKQENLVLHDVGVIVLSVLLAYVLAKTDVLISLLTSSQEMELLGSFIAGLFFTSVFTTAPAIVTLGEIAQVQPIFHTALLGAAGAVIGDLVIFTYVKDIFSVHVGDLVKMRGGFRRLRLLLSKKTFRWITFFIGGLIIASPLPDELGVSILGFSKMKRPYFILLSFVFNFLGIVAIGLVARSVE